jgi:zinc protease
MITYQSHSLSNGLRVISHYDDSTPLAILNILYDVGAKDEDPEKTGFAHLFEHLMFGGSVNIPEYDTPLQMAGGENNAFTSNDITNYYNQLPASNIETAFWLESDRLLSLAFTPKSLEVQRSVVIEEFKQRYLNQPYGDVWHHLRELSYTQHPYQWPTIGKEVSHIEKARLEDVKSFFFKHYNPANAILVVAGNCKPEHVFALAEKWFGPIENRNVYVRNIAKEPIQTASRTKKINAKVPLNALYKTYPMSDRLSEGYIAADMLSDILSNGKSSRLYQRLVLEQKLFSSVDAYISGELDGGLFTIQGKLNKNVPFEKAELAIQAELDKIQQEKVTEAQTHHFSTFWFVEFV